MLNQITLQGRLTRDPDLRYTKVVVPWQFLVWYNRLPQKSRPDKVFRAGFFCFLLNEPQWIGEKFKKWKAVRIETVHLPA